MTGYEAFEIIVSTGRPQSEVAALIGVSPVAVQKWKHGGAVSRPIEMLLRLIRERPEILEVLAKVKAAP